MLRGLLVSIALALLGAVTSQSRALPDTQGTPAAANGTGADPPFARVAGLDWRTHDVGNLFLLVKNWGEIGSNPGTGLPWAGEPSARWPGRSTTEYLWAGGLWLGARVDGATHVTTSTYEREFSPGQTELDRIYVTRQGAPHGRRRPWPGADDDLDGLVDEDWLDGRDNDRDGQIDEDFAGISDQMFACTYDDTATAIRSSYPEHVPLGIQVRQTSLAWSDALHADCIGFDFHLLNLGSTRLDSVYVGFFLDFDIGPRGWLGRETDDMAGFWEDIVPAKVGITTRNLKLSLGYMWDADGDDQRSQGYIGMMFLGAQDPSAAPYYPPRLGPDLCNFRMFSGHSDYAHGGDPGDDAERYQVLAGTAPFSLPPPSADSLRSPRASNAPGDYRLLVSAGPWTSIAPGDTFGFQAALVIGYSFEGMVATAARTRLLYDGEWFDCDGDPSTGIDGRELRLCGPRLAGRTVRIDPCDSLCNLQPDPHCFVTVPDTGCVWVNGDCDIERQVGFVTGVDGRECAVHWQWGPITPVRVEALEASTSPGGVRLRWRIPPTSRAELLGVEVQRAESAPGPYARITAAPLDPAPSMSWDDATVRRGQEYWYRLELRSRDGSDDLVGPVGVVFEPLAPRMTALTVPVQLGAGAVQIRYDLAEPASHVQLAVYDALGRRVRVLQDGIQEAGSYLRYWDGRDGSSGRAPRGIYFVRLRAGRDTLARKLLLLHG